MAPDGPDMAAGLTGIALACAGHEVVLSDVAANLTTVRGNLERNLSSGTSARVVCYTWGQSLPEEMRGEFGIVVCADLLYHVWNGRLQSEFLATLHDLYRRRGEASVEFLFAGLIRSGRQEQAVLDAAAQRMGLVLEELDVLDADAGDAEALFRPDGKYRLVRLCTPRADAKPAGA